jgi:hypothetical protein
MVLGTILGLMSDTISASPTTEAQPRRRPWTLPQLVVHDSMMVLTQHFFGAPAATMLLRQGFSCITPPGCQ